jgi:L-amino acid N-acyltransferase YncA
MNFSYRDAVRGDLSQIVDIYNAAIPGRQSTCDTEPISVESRIEWFNKHSQSRRPIWVAVDEDSSDIRVAGYLSFSYFMNERPGYSITSDMGLYLHPEYQGHGLGKFLLKAAIDKAPSLGIETFATTIFASNTPSIRLFRGAGFEKWGHFPRVARLGTIEHDLVMMGLRIGNN